MRNQNKQKLHIVLPFFVALIAFAAFGYGIYLVASSASYFDNEAKSIAQQYAAVGVDSLESNVRDSFSEIKTIADEAASITGMEAADAFGKKIIQQKGFSCFQLLNEGVPEYRYGPNVGSFSADEVQSLIASGKFGVSPVYDDLSMGVPCIAVYCPVAGNADIDGVLVYYPVLDLTSGVGELHPFVKYYFFIKGDGSIVESRIADGVKTDVSRNAFTYLYNITESKAEAEAVEQLAARKVGGSLTVHIDGNACVAVCMPVSSINGECLTVQIFEADELLQSEYAMYDKVLVAVIFFGLLTAVTLIVSIIMKVSDRKKLHTGSEQDSLLGCNTLRGFMAEATQLLEQNKYSRYAVVYLNIRKYHYMLETIGSAQAEETLKFVCQTAKGIVDSNESFGHVASDSFVMLLHYTDINELSERIKFLGMLISKRDGLKDANIGISLTVGVYDMKGDRDRDMRSMIDCARIAMEANKAQTSKVLTFYDSDVAATYTKGAEIEARMWTALKNRDFKLFFQPKYGIKKDRIDSAEVLVRWYDQNLQTYVAPDVFISVFEANGFICELDHYVFEETCRFMNDFTIHGDKLVPLSVNVSRVTAIQPDFLQFYISKRNEYGIPPGFLTLEFTESFATESYEFLENLLTELKKNGFNCSLDDFGMGNASLIAVKELPVDEIKLDRALIKPGKNQQKDNTVLEMLISVSKGLGMKVTQEGVETREDLMRLRELGCDLIQGYYYAKPMHVLDFIDFMKEDTSLAGIVRKYRK